MFPNAAPGAGTAYNYNFALAFDDSFLGLPVVFNPYVSLFYNDKGGSTVVLGKRSDAYRVTFGMNPTINFAKQFGVPLTICVPDFSGRRLRPTSGTGTTGRPQTYPAA